MTTFKTNKQLEAELRQLDALLGDDYEPTNSTCDYAAYKAYSENFAEAREYLLPFADILAQTGRPYITEESEKIRRLIDAFESVSSCNEVLLAATNFMIAQSLKQTIGEVPTGNPYMAAVYIVSAVKEQYKPNYNEFIGGNE